MEKMQVAGAGQALSAGNASTQGSQKYFSLKRQQGTPKPFSNAIRGTNAIQWNAMDLHMPTANTTSASLDLTSQKSHGDDKMQSLLARNILIQRKLTERKRFDSADYAMAGNSDKSAPESSSEIGDNQREPHEVSPVSDDAGASFSPEAPIQTASQVRIPGIPENTFRADRSRYGALGMSRSMASGAVSARNILMQKKLREKRHFDSADYQIEQYKNSHPDAEATSSAAETLQSAIEAAVENIKKQEETRLDPMQFSAAGLTLLKSIPDSAATIKKVKDPNLSPCRSGSNLMSHALPGNNASLARKLAEKTIFHALDNNCEIDTNASCIRNETSDCHSEALTTFNTGSSSSEKASRLHPTVANNESSVASPVYEQQSKHIKFSAEFLVTEPENAVEAEG
uniref:AlNc14C3G457 protein n=1 Tax=Albugo laibachii Nc14 TaxID=890382 RepID=F0VZX9_9STRA|nr:AlNc14C3G457 [Albugo laibachii Nc14]|eukprot:CCA14350.1 AlNc14C3G457 [Albugo laibachii Nc14]